MQSQYASQKKNTIAAELKCTNFESLEQIFNVADTYIEWSMVGFFSMVIFGGEIH